MKLGLAEILDKASKLPSKKEKIAFLQANNSNALQTILDCAYNPNIVWNLPEGTPPYKKSNVLDGEGMLYQEVRRFYLFLRGTGSPVEFKDLKREQLFLGLLESVKEDDAELICAIKDKKLPYKGLNEGIIREAFPNLLPAKEKKSVEDKEAV